MMTYTLRLLGLLVSTALLAREAQAQDWTARFPAAPECSAPVLRRANADMAGVEAGTATLAVRVVRFGSTEGIGHAMVILTSLDSASMPPRSSQAADSSSTRVFQEIPAGRYQLIIRRIGYSARTDSVVVRPRSADTVTVALRTFHDEYRNTYNCRPRRFRYPGERACLDDTTEADFAVAYARAFADSAERKPFPQIPPFDSSDVALISDEATCERASMAYGEPGDPPRRVIVVRMGQLFMVYDPHEPLTAGEWDIRRFFDRRWESILDLAG